MIWMRLWPHRLGCARGGDEKWAGFWKWVGYFEGKTNRICDKLDMRHVSKRGSKDDTKVWLSNWKNGIAIL